MSALPATAEGPALEAVELTLHFTIEVLEDGYDIVLRAIGPRRKWPERDIPETFEEAFEVAPVPLSFEAICNNCDRAKSPFLCDACTVEANIEAVGPEQWLLSIGVDIEPGDFVLRGNLVWRRSGEGQWSAAFVAKSFDRRPTPASGQYATTELSTFEGKRVLIGFDLPDGGQEHLWIAVTGIVRAPGVRGELEGLINDVPVYRDDFQADDEVVFMRSEIEDVL